MRTRDFHFDLPPELIAQEPADRRDGSRLLVLQRQQRQWQHRSFPDLLEYLQPGDVLILNNSKVIPARLHGQNSETGGKFEILLLEEAAPNEWWAMMRPGKRAKLGVRIQVLDKNQKPTSFTAEVLEFNEAGHRRLRFAGTPNIFQELESIGELPLPPYTERHGEKATDRERYQTVYAAPAGSVAAPTAGLHFTPELLEKIRARGIKIGYVTLHVGAGTFLPVKAELLADHRMHSERIELGSETAALILAARKAGHRVVAVGTTCVRTLESVARMNDGKINVYAGKTDIFLHPPARFQVVDALLTNFHLPESTLLMLVSAFAAPGELHTGRELMLAVYADAVREKYRFFSYGDAMLLL
ncbi:MAG TPA: tRNA preQ1(34) S-adenosylmethionine ribosyltransferase-isomerase QueA [Verrucomicrobiae bacterium]